MKLDEQVVSLEIAKKLKELGVKQNSLFIWEYHGKEGERLGIGSYRLEYYKTHEGLERQKDDLSAYTVAELGEMLFKSNINCRSKTIQDALPQFWSNHNMWEIHTTHYYNERGNQVVDLKIDIVADTEADARGKMLIYLIENKLIDIKALRRVE